MAGCAQVGTLGTYAEPLTAKLSASPLGGPVEQLAQSAELVRPPPPRLVTCALAGHLAADRPSEGWKC